MWCSFRMLETKKKKSQNVPFTPTREQRVWFLSEMSLSDVVMDANTVHNEKLEAFKNKKVLKKLRMTPFPIWAYNNYVNYYFMHIIPFFKRINFHFNDRKNLLCKLRLNDLTVKDWFKWLQHFKKKHQCTRTGVWFCCVSGMTHIIAVI